MSDHCFRVEDPVKFFWGQEAQLHTGFFQRNVLLMSQFYGFCCIFIANIGA